MVCRKVLRDHIIRKLSMPFQPHERLINVLERAIELGNEGRRDTSIDVKRYGYTYNTAIRARQLIADYQLETFIEIDEDTV